MKYVLEEYILKNFIYNAELQNMPVRDGSRVKEGKRR